MKNSLTIFALVFVVIAASVSASAQCFDMSDLHARNITCTTGTYANPYRNTGVVNGRHTVMNDTTAYDPNVPQLRTIPIGKTNSIRLGNQSTGAQAESIMYEYYVDAANPILLLQYAAVMQNPNHTAAEQPRLVLEILNSRDEPIDPDCNSFDFVSSQTLGWNSMYSGSLLWKDWTSVGVDLSSYIGQTIKIRLTNYDCEHGGHYGYAYLYLDCAPLEIRTKACGDVNSMTFSAPQGFQYSWYVMSNGHKVVKATTQDISVPIDGTTYYCEISQIGKPECAYTTSVIANTRYPLANFSIHQVPGCADTLYLTDLSGISEDGIHLNNPHEDCDIVLWDLGDGRTFTSGNSAIAPFTYAHAGTYTITQTVRLVDGNCFDAFSRAVTVRGTEDTHIGEIWDTTCTNNPYSFDGNLLTKSGRYLQHTTTRHGCDSTTILHLTINQAYERIDTMYICKNSTINFFDQIVNKPGEYFSNYTTISGCDSIYKLVVKTAPEYVKDIEATICANETYDFNGQILDKEGTYTDTLQTIYGCDSVINLELHVLPTYLIDRYVETCQEDTFWFRGRLIDHPGIFYDSLYTQHGCDSVFRFIYNKTPGFAFDAAETIHQGDSILFQGLYFSTPGLHTVTYKTTSGCDSVYRLQLTVLPKYFIQEEFATCNNEPYIWRGHTYYEGGIYYDSLKTILGHDSVYMLHLTVNPSYLIPTYVETCEGDPFDFRGKTITHAGVYYDSLYTHNGCDSVYMLVYNITPTYHFTDTAYLCKGNTYNFHGKELTNAGVYFDSLRTVSGCDSIYELHLNFYPYYLTEDSVTICNNDTYIWGGKLLNHTGIYRDTFQSIYGCDSISVLYLKVNPSYITERNISLCPSETFTISGTTLHAPVVYNDTLISMLGCDSIIHYIISLNPSYIVEKRVSICRGESYIFRGKTVTQSGTYTDTLKTITGCDSIFRLILTYKQSYEFHQMDTVPCGITTYKWRNHQLYETGTYYDSLITVEGCDSVYVLHLTFNHTYLFPTYVETCEGDPFEFRGRIIAKAGIYYDSLYTHSGCDSVYMLVYNITPTYHFTDTAYLCKGSTYNFRGRILSNAGVYFDSLRTISGCDSIYELHLTYYPNYYTEDSIAICTSEKYIWGGRELKVSGIYRDTFQTIHGCDSICVLHLYVRPSYISHQHFNLCPSETFTLSGVTLHAPAIYYDTIMSSLGCDSVICYELALDPSYVIETQALVCPGDAYNFRGRNLTIPGTYVDTFHTVAGCDSIYRLVLQNRPSYEFTTIDTIECGTDPYEWRGKKYTKTGVYYDSLITTDGCDSIYVLKLTYHRRYLITTIDTICSVHPYDFRGRILTETGIYYDSLVTESGCDSIFKLKLTVFETLRDTMQESVCITDSAMKAEWPYATEGEYIDTICSTEEKRCHIRVVYFSILTPSEIFYANIPDVCADDSLFEIDFRYNGSTPHSYSLYYGNDAHVQGFKDIINAPFEGGVFGIVPKFPKNGYVRPDTYHVRMEFDNGACEPNLYGMDLTFRVRYPAWIIEQNWNDVIALLNEANNGGYVFSHYDWYVNGRLVNYAHGTNLYMQEIGVGDVVELYPTRKGETYSIPTCPIVIEDRRNSDISEHPVLIYPTKVNKSNARVRVNANHNGTYTLYDLYGNTIASGSIEVGDTDIVLPAISGCYLMALDQTNGQRSITKLLVF